MVTSLVVVQPDAPATPQLDPVNPFVHMQEQTSCEMMFVPPFAQVSCDWH
jgi:hypothetical protein